MTTADYAEVTVTLTVTIRADKDGTTSVQHKHADVSPPSLIRAWTKKEVRDGVAESPWYEGGAAILNPVRATNGVHLATLAHAAAARWGTVEPDPTPITEATYYAANREPEPYVVTETTVVNLGSTPGECYGWECAACQTITGLAFGSHHSATDSLARHLDKRCEA